MRVGTKSVLFGAHCFLLHPWFVAWGWWQLYGFPWDPRLWVAFFVHDLGYLGKPNMDGAEGERHPVLGARIMHRLFDRGESTTWGDFSLFHSRYFAKANSEPVSRLCYADKLAIALTPGWLYLPMARASGEIHEYLKMAAGSEKVDASRGRRRWYADLQQYMREWVAEHRDGRDDTWTNLERRRKTQSGVWE